MMRVSMPPRLGSGSARAKGTVMNGSATCTTSFTEEGRKVSWNVDVGYPRTDAEAWEHPGNNKYRWVYNKLYVAQTQEFVSGPIGTNPPIMAFPVIVRPIYNLWGGGCESKMVHHRDGLNKCHPGCFWQPYLKGGNITIDFDVVDDGVVALGGYIGHHSRDFMYDYWREIEDPCDTIAENWVRKWLYDWGYRGPVNVEMVARTVVEVHLRLSDMHYLGDHNIFAPLWGEYNVSYVMPPLPAGSKCKFELDPEEDWCEPPGGVRIGMVCGPDVLECAKARMYLAAHCNPRIPRGMLEGLT